MRLLGPAGGLCGAEANAQTVDGIGVEVSSNSLTALSGEIHGGILGSSAMPFLHAKLGGEKSIKGAVVTADIYDADGQLVLANIAMKDDGVMPDARAGDGQYALSLTGLLPPGEYTAVFKAVTNSDSRIASLGALIKGLRDEELPVEVIGRISEFGFTLEAGAPGVMATSTPASSAPSASVGFGGGGSSGSGCSMNPSGTDAGLALLLLAALAGGAMRRRQSRRLDDSQKALTANSAAAI